MEIVWPNPDKYVLAVSGGVDSMVLLDMLHQQQGIELVVAHLDHGIRHDSAKDLKLVKMTAQQYGLTFVAEIAELGQGTSEARARGVRYEFLRRVMKEQRAQAIITAHHQDDALETAILNLLRGTGRKGLTALGNQPDILRPLLAVSKTEILDYAIVHNLDWREDSTNLDTSYLRNYIRQQIMPKITAKARADLLAHMEDARQTNQMLDTVLVNHLAKQSETALKRLEFIMLPHAVAREVLAAWLRQYELRDFDRGTIERLVVAAKTGRPGRQFPILKNYYLHIEVQELTISGLRPSTK